MESLNTKCSWVGSNKYVVFIDSVKKCRDYQIKYGGETNTSLGRTRSRIEKYDHTVRQLQGCGLINDILVNYIMKMAFPPVGRKILQKDFGVCGRKEKNNVVVDDVMKCQS